LRKSSLLIAFLLVAGLAVSARAESLADGQVPFEFTAGGAKLPAGHYRILAPSMPGDSMLMVRNEDTGKTTLAEYVTRIASRDDDKPVLVFDVVGGQHVLSELHLGGSDGYLFPGAAKTPHTHKEVKVN
jgi:hypothetical protein